MKNNIFLILFLVVSFFSVSCKKDLKPQESDAATVASDSVKPAPSENLGPQPNQPNPNQQVQNPQVQNPQMQNPQLQNNVQQSQNKVAKGMNPPHGQPNHRCDISVGAPLNTPVTNKSQTITPPIKQPGSATVQQVTSNGAAIPQTLQAPVATAAGMNPPHGQEGHLCSVAVGAPLPKK